MGLTNGSIGLNAVDSEFIIKKRTENDKVIALAGNPNVGKSTVFNALTGMNQHTGNWPGKTVTNAFGYCDFKDNSYVFVDIPGTYSLMAHSQEEEVARNFVLFGGADLTVVVCDATCIERNLNLVLQIIETSQNVVVCVNLLDEAKRKGIKINLELISKRLGVSVVGVVARKKKTLSALLDTLTKEQPTAEKGVMIRYPAYLEQAIAMVKPAVEAVFSNKINPRWLSLRLIEGEDSIIKEISEYLKTDVLQISEIAEAVKIAKELLKSQGIDREKLDEMVVSALVGTAQKICEGAVTYENGEYSLIDRKIDKILTSKLTGYPVMVLLLLMVFWITIVGANYPSEALSWLLFKVQDLLTEVFMFLGAPDWLHSVVVLGIYRVLAWVVSVMLPPMAIFFPLFTLLEDVGYLPRIAYNLDNPFRRCDACGKQALTMAMGFGCNAAGIIGCRIIDSPRERLLAILTNNFVPCNGRFPTVILIIGMFLIGEVSGTASSMISAIILTAVILLGVFATFFVTKVLSKTVLKGVPSSFTLELPPYRRPQILKVLVRSVKERTLFVLGRAAAVAAPAGLIIWLMANIMVSDVSLLKICADFLDPFAKLMGLDGVILIAFILGFPANEIVVPIIIMAYTAEGSLVDLGGANEIKQLFVNNGWTVITAINTIIFSLFHWPCSTTLITIKKETGSVKWTLLSAVIPTVLGVIVCILINFLTKPFI